MDASDNIDENETLLLHLAQAMTSNIQLPRTFLAGSQRHRENLLDDGTATQAHRHRTITTFFSSSLLILQVNQGLPKWAPDQDITKGPDQDIAKGLQ